MRQLSRSILTACLVAAAILPVAAQTNIAGGTISTDTTWDVAGSPYIIQGNVTVVGTDGADGVTTLTIDPGVTVAFDGDFEILIGSTSGTGDPGALIADAGGDTQIVFTSNQGAPAAGDWNRVRFEFTTDPSTVLRNVLMQYGGSGFSTGMIHANQNTGTTIVLDQLTMMDSASHDIRLLRGTLDIDNCDIESFIYSTNTPTATWDGCTFNNWGDTPSRVGVNDVDDVTQGNAFNAGADPRLEVLTGTVTMDASWGNAAGRLIPTGSITVLGTDGPDNVTTLTIEPGVTVAWTGNHELLVGATSGAGDPGALIADAGGQAQIVFTSNDPAPAPGDWNRIQFRFTTDPSSILRNVLLEYGASSGNSGAIYANQAAGTTVVLDQVSVSNSSNYDIYLSRGVLDVDSCSIESFYYGTSTDTHATWDGCTFNNWGDRVSRTDLDDIDEVTHGNTFNAGADPRLESWGGTASLDGSWGNAAGRIIPVANVTILGTDGGDGVTTVTIEPGVTVAFSGNRELVVGSTSGAGDPGALIADAGGQAQITFTTNNGVPAAGDWNRIRFEQTTDASTVLRNVRLEYGGSSVNSGPMYANHSAATTVVLDQVTVADSANYDFYLQRGTLDIDDCTIDSFFYSGNLPNATWDGCTFNAWGDTVSRVSLENVDEVTHGNTFNAGADPRLEVHGGNLTLDASWGNAAGRLIPVANITVIGTDGADMVTTLNVEPGVIVAFSGNREMVLGSTSGAGDPGALIADAGGQAQITFTTNDPAPSAGDWNRIRFALQTDPTTVLRNVRLEYGGSSVNSGALYLNHDGATMVVLDQVTIANSANYDIYLLRGTTDIDDSTMNSFYYNSNTPHATWDGCTFNEWGDTVSRVGLENVDEVTHGNTFNPGADPRLQVLGGTMTLDASWAPDAGRLIPVGNITILGTDTADAVTTLTLEPGVTVAWSGSREMIVGSASGAGDPGALIADAGGQAQIVFTTNNPAPAAGDWQRIRFENTADPTTVLRNVLLEYGGSGASTGTIYSNQAAGTTIVLDQVTITDSATYDIRLFRGTLDVDSSTMSSFYYNSNTPTATWDGCTFNNWGDTLSRVAIEDVDEVTHGNTFNAGADPRLEVHSGSVTLDASWGPAAGRLIPVGSITVIGTDSADMLTTLTIEPGVTVAMGGAHELVVGSTSGAGDPGALIADAGGQAQILFTTNDPAPAAGDWQRIRLASQTDPSTVLRNVRLEYAGFGGSSAAIYANQASATPIVLDQVEIVNSAGHDIRLLRGSLDVDGCTASAIYYNSNTPSATWDGCTFNGWGNPVSRVGLADVGALTHGNTFNAIPAAFTEVWSGTVAADDAWAKDAGPLHATSTITVLGTDGPDARTTLQLEGGVTLKFPNGARLDVGSGSGAGDPGELLVDGITDVPGETVNLNSTNGAPSIGDWQGVRVLVTGRAELTDVQIRFADIGLQVSSGTLGTIDQVVVNRANIGFDFSSTVFEQQLDRIKTKNCDTGVRATSSAPTIRNGELLGDTWGVDNTTPGTHCVDAINNWWGDPGGPSGAAPVVGCNGVTPSGTGSPITEAVLFDPWLDAPDDDGDGIDKDDGDGFPDPCTGGNTVGCDDNCPLVANASQADEDNDGVGDACDTNPSLTVSNDPADGADFPVIQEAVDAAFESGMTVLIFPGLGPYNESVRLDVDKVFTILRMDDGTPDPVIVDGGVGPAFQAINKVGARAMELEELTLRGDRGVHALVDTSLHHLDFDMVSNEALDLDAGSHTLCHSAIDAARVGADVAAGADLTLEAVRMTNLADCGVVTGGDVIGENLLIAGCVDGVRLSDAAATVDLAFATITDNTGFGIDNTPGGTVTVDRSVLWDNALDDLTNVACASVSWSDTEVPDCSGVNDNLNVDPLIDPLDYMLQAGSPCLDHGPDPSLFTGDPPTDLDGNPRQLDNDGDQLAQSDCGAFEHPRSNPVPGEVLNVRWFDPLTIEWDPEPSAIEYHVYRDLVTNISYASFGVCRDDLDANRTDTQLFDVELPNPGEVFTYLFTADDGVNEGTLGFASTTERSNFPANVCP